MKYPYEAHFLVCTGGRCNDGDLGKNRGESIRSELKDLNKKLGRKKTVRICAVSCLDRCDDAPNMVVHPSGHLYSKLTRKQAIRAYHAEIEALRESAKV